MGDQNLAIAEPPPQAPRPNVLDADARIRELVNLHFDFVWRVLRRLGVPAGVVEDATQEVFIIADKKTREIWPEQERSYLFAIALRVAAAKRRAEKRRPDQLEAHAWAEVMDSSPGPDVMLDERRAREVMDRILESIPLEQRAVFILFELEDMTTQEVADALGIPSGTVASRLRRARELFLEQVKRIRARSARAGGP